MVEAAVEAADRRPSTDSTDSTERADAASRTS